MHRCSAPRFLAILFLALLFAPRLAVGEPEIVPPQRLDSTAAPYPPDGTGDASVVLVVVVDPTGAVTDVAVREGAPPFAEAAALAVTQSPIILPSVGIEGGF